MLAPPSCCAFIPEWPGAHDHIPMLHTAAVVQQLLEAITLAPL